MIAALAAAAALLEPTHAQAEALDDALVAFQAACLDVRGDREAFNAVARSKDWKPRFSGARPPRDWMDVYLSDPLVVHLAHTPAQTSPLSIPAQLICTVDRIPYESGWRARMAAEVVDGAPLGAAASPPSSYVLPSGFELGIWDLADGSRIHATAIESERRIELSINYDYPSDTDSPALAQAVPAALMRKGCVETAMDASRLGAVARSEGWARLRITRSPGDPTRIDAFHAGSGQVMLAGGDAPEQATCAVMIDGPQGDWRAGLSALALELGLAPQPAVAPGDSAMWFAPGGYALSWSRAGGALVVSLSHARVSNVAEGNVVVVEAESVEVAPHQP